MVVMVFCSYVKTFLKTEFECENIQLLLISKDL